MDKTAKRILFVCTGNVDRSPTAENLLKDKKGFKVLSSGTGSNAHRRISVKLIDWADIIFVMEEHHKETILGLKSEAENKTIVLGVPDIYFKNNPELIETLKTKLTKHLNIDWS